MVVLGIESSCDETAAAIVADDRRILADTIFAQIAEHTPFGGVVPEIAARAHLDHLDDTIAAAMRQAGLDFKDLDGIAVTGGPGLIGGVIVGVMMAKAIAFAHGKPFIAVNHLEGHALTARLTDAVAFPYLLLLVSGGHCQLLVVEGVGRYRRLGATIDDAAGEAFDKAAKLMGLGFPGGPAVAAAAAKATAPFRDLPRPMKGRPDCNFSFSGLKTALRQRVDALRAAGAFDDTARADLAAGFQQAVVDCLIDRTSHALAMAKADHPTLSALVVAGGVAANQQLRAALQELAAKHGLPIVAPPPRLCTDNAAMIAWAGIERFRLGELSDFDYAPRPRWPLDSAASALAGAGVKA
ncbi:tRNA (adenosine(37)-N6)-threonylcarbamoyltransferase complex transferase subunit TsaD [Dongia sp.]|uniref:tRNA (adenosine(37)-N6)-threonylcarbamoyltransferase complex transferase subunit TsaD n=1 Tax=Dongia sp. TaxID=1977262 RepID=UPI0035B1C2E1